MSARALACVTGVVALAGCTLANPFGMECVSDQNCGCSGCCIGYRCANTASSGLGSDGGGAASFWVDTFAGGADAGGEDGLGAAARFDYPAQLALDAQGNLYVADSGGNCVRKIDAAGNVTTLDAADAPCGGAGLDNPWGVAVDGAGDVFVANTGMNCLVSLVPGASGGDGRFHVLAGTCQKTGYNCGDTATRSVQFAGPMGLAYAAPYLFVADASNNVVRYVHDGDGVVGTLAGQAGGTAPLADGTCDFGQSCGAENGSTFNNPTSLTAAAGALFVADGLNCAVREISLARGCDVSTLGASGCPMFTGQRGPGRLANPAGVAVAPSGVVFVADPGNHRVAALDASGALTNVAGDGASGFADGRGATARFASPSGIALDAQGRLFVADGENHRIRVLTPVAP